MFLLHSIREHSQLLQVNFFLASTVCSYINGNASLAELSPSTTANEILIALPSVPPPRLPPAYKKRGARSAASFPPQP
jgi:hypothetical protein